MFTVSPQHLLILPSYHHLSHLNAHVFQQSVMPSSPSSLHYCRKPNPLFQPRPCLARGIITQDRKITPAPKTCTSWKRSSCPWGPAHTVTKFTDPRQLVPVKKEKPDSLSLLLTASGVLQKPHLPETCSHFVMKGYLPENKDNAVQCDEDALPYALGKIFAIRLPKHWTKELGQSPS